MQKVGQLVVPGGRDWMFFAPELEVDRQGLPVHFLRGDELVLSKQQEAKLVDRLARLYVFLSPDFLACGDDFSRYDGRIGVLSLLNQFISSSHPGPGLT